MLKEKPQYKTLDKYFRRNREGNEIVLLFLKRLSSSVSQRTDEMISYLKCNKDNKQVLSGRVVFEKKWKEKDRDRVRGR